MTQVGIELLSVFGMHPVRFVELAADLGVQNISMGLTSMPPAFNPENHPAWSLRDDAQLRREMTAAMQHHGVAISLGEGIGVRVNADVHDSASDLDLMCELGVKRINAVSLDPDRQRTLDQYSVLAEMVTARGLEMTMEFGPSLSVATLGAALEYVRTIARPNVRVLIDTMHLVRSGSTAKDVAALDPDLIGYVQLCDAPLVSTYSSYMEEAMFDRKPPGEGELPLADLVAALPGDRIYSLEIPMRAKAQAGIGARERLQPCVAAARTLLSGAPR